MEPITVLTYTVASFFGYYVGADIYNYIKLRSEFNEIRYDLDGIKLRLDKINSNVFHKNHNQV
jgi:hypothetical protein